MKLTRTALFVGCCMASTFSSAEIDLPHALSDSLTATQINENLAALSDAANTALADIEALQQVTTTKVLERMTAGDEITLLTQGDSTVKVSCVFNNGSESSEGFELELWTESTAAGTLAVNYDIYGGYYGEEGNQVSTWVSWSTSSDTNTSWGNEIDQGITVSPTGHVVMMDGESFGYGINVQGSDCLITGQISSFQGEEAPESFDASLLDEDDLESPSEGPF
ncbi:MAG TPA: hypothetical protein DIC30_12375 [Oceanospirillales bacterium]|nr:hypothetical protein [Oceanospirillales bacterium]|tara:strand:+ start:176 stop:844 length:669 start_codon:yes stop_codon:yes gene_type:complete